MQNVNGQELFDRSHSLKYCNYLFLSKKYESAFSEFERIKFYHYDNDSIYARALLACSYLNEKNKLIKFYQESGSKYNSSHIYRQVFYISNPLGYSVNELKDKIQKDSLFNSEQKANTQLQVLIKNNAWEKSMDYMVSNPDISKSRKKDIIAIINKGYYTKFKSPILGAGMSALVPGLGKIYAGETGDGILSMITVSALIASTVRSIYISPENPWTFVLSTLSVGFYSGNIYGSYHSVKKTNRKKQQLLNEESYKVFNNF